MFGSTPMGMIKNGFDASSKAVKNNVLKRVHRKCTLATTSKILKLRTNKKLRNKAHHLCRKAKKSSLTWDPFFWTIVVCLFLIAFFYNYWWAILLVLIGLLVILKIIIETHALFIYKRNIVPKKMRNAKIPQPRLTLKKPLNPADYYVI